MGTSNKFKTLLPNYKSTYSATPKTKGIKPEYQNTEMAQNRNPFGQTQELFNRRKRKSDQNKY